MEKGTIVKFSEAGLDWLYPIHNGRREKAKKKRFKFSGIDRNDPGVIHVKRTTSDIFYSYHIAFLEPE